MKYSVPYLKNVASRALRKKGIFSHPNEIQKKKKLYDRYSQALYSKFKDDKGNIVIIENDLLDTELRINVILKGESK